MPTPTPTAHYDLRVSEITGVFAAMREVTRLALEGYSESEVAEHLEWRREDVRTAAELQGYTLPEASQRLDVCPKCGNPASELMNDGFCRRCFLRKRIERLNAVYDEEERRAIERLENEIDATKQRGCRMREEYGLNPRKGRRQEEAEATE